MIQNTKTTQLTY